jgi:thioredoxin 1
MSPILHINEDSFEAEVIQSDLPVVVDFWAQWCGPCKMLAPALDEIAVENATRAKLVKVDIDANPELAARFGVQAIPTLLYFAKGKLADRSSGVVGKKAIVSKLEKLL